MAQGGRSVFLSKFFYLISGNLLAKRLFSSASQRASLGHRQATASQYRAQFRLFMALDIYLQIADIAHYSILLIFVEFLHVNGVKIPTIRNYLSAVKHYFLLFSFPVHMFQNRRLLMLLRSISINATYTPKLRPVFTIDILSKLVQLSSSIPLGKIYKAIFLTAFFGYLRLSSLVPTSKFHKFHLLRSHFQIHPLGYLLCLHRTKTHQHYDQSHSIILPRICNSILCPVSALNDMWSEVPAQPSDVAFGYWEMGRYVPVVAYKVRSTLAKCIRQLNLGPSLFTFHAFRRSGATYSFNNNVSFQDIRLHGSWKSDAIYAYLQTTSTADKVAQHFQSTLQIIH